MKILLIPAELVDPLDQLSTITLERCKAGLVVWESGVFDRILLTGGRFLPPERQSRPAAEIMRDWFLQQGVAPESILLETTSLDTYENVSVGLQVLEQFDLSRVQITVLTQYQHALRFFLTFFLAHGRLVRTVPIRQPQLSWFRWLVEWLILIPCHAIDWRGRFILARWNRRQCQLAAQPL